jgi:GntR family transcriptional regulator
MALLEPQLLALARHAQELELPAEPVLRRLGKLLGER